MSQYKGDFFLLIAAMIGGLGFVFIKYLLEWHFTPFQIIAGRFLIATLFLYVIYHKELRQITIQEWKYGSILGILLFLLFVYACFFRPVSLSASVGAERNEDLQTVLVV